MVDFLALLQSWSVCFPRLRLCALLALSGAFGCTLIAGPGDFELRDGSVSDAGPDAFEPPGECSSPEDCGSADNGSFACIDGRCALSCSDGFGDCDGRGSTGCETDLTADPSHCGGCETDCAAMDDRVVFACVDSMCAFADCNDGFDDCDNDRQSCEADLRSSTEHCGDCGSSCSGQCRDGVCAQFAEVSIGHNHLCALDTTGRVLCRGQNYRGQLGNGNRQNSDGVTVLDESGEPFEATAIAAGFQHTCAIGAERRRVHCWGTNTYGVIGEASTPSTHPVLIEGADPFGGQQFAQLAVGDSTNCALSDEGEIWCWGRNLGGAGFGSAFTDDLRRARRLQLGGRRATSVDLGVLFGCALTEGRDVMCWGLQRHGRLGLDWPEDAEAVVPTIVMGDAIAVSTGAEHACAIHENGTLHCWGLNSSLQLGMPGGNRSTPTQVPELESVTEVTCGRAHTCAKVGGQHRCWGRRNRGALGDEDFGSMTSSPVAPMGVGGAAHLEAGAEMTCAIEAGALSCWGADFRGRMGTAAPVFLPSPRAAFNSAALSAAIGGALSNVVVGGRPADGAPHACGIAADELYCWGNPNQGATSGVSSMPSHMPTPVGAPGATGEVTAVSAVDSATAFVQGGDVFAMGSNVGGRVNPGSSASRHFQPQRVLAGTGAIDVGLGGAHGCAQTSRGVECWGNNDRSQLGDEDEDEVGPVVVDGLGEINGIAVGSNFSCALSSLPGQGRRVRCWGAGNEYRLGDDRGDSAEPVEVALPREPLQVSVGAGQACAVLDDDSLYCWGRNNLGQAGGSVGNHGPEEIIDGGVAEVRCYFEHSCARMTDETVRCWGSNRNFELGSALPLRSTSTPVVIEGLGEVEHLAGGSSSVTTCVQTGDGHMCWGTCADGVCSTGDGRVAAPTLVTGIEL